MSDDTPERQPSHDTATDPSELTVLDWFKSLFSGDPIEIPESDEEPAPDRPRRPPPARVEAEKTPGPSLWERRRDWLTPEKLRLPAALLLAFGAQFGLAQRSGSPLLQAGAYLVAAALLGWAYWAGDLDLPSGQEGARITLSDQVRGRPLLIGLAF
ncbi:MAG: hypothetical protein R3191_04630, partial [Anaerolineales bacterium]|nr:hypothetical protein [Anaerolineales bacterium]